MFALSPYGAQYSAAEYTNESAAILNISAPAPHPVPLASLIDYSLS